jgi:biopolymer transport protein ExbB
MWPILFLSLVTVGVIVERILFVLRDGGRQDPQTLHRVLALIEQGKLEQALEEARPSQDPAVQLVAEALEQRDGFALTSLLQERAQRELERHERGLVILDTAVTLGPLLGLLGTVTGMMRAFGMVGTTDLAGQQAVITGGVAESLIAVTFGLTVAIVAIVPLNLLGARVEKVRRRLESTMDRVQALLSSQPV